MIKPKPKYREIIFNELAELGHLAKKNKDVELCGLLTAVGISIMLDETDKLNQEVLPYLILKKDHLDMLRDAGYFD